MMIKNSIGIVVAGKCYCLRSPFIGNAGEFIGNELKCFIPGNLFELSPFTFWVCPQQWVRKAIRVLTDIPTRHPLGAPCPDIIRRFRVAFLIDDLAVTHKNFRRTLPWAGVAEALDDFRTFYLGKSSAKILGHLVHAAR